MQANYRRFFPNVWRSKGSRFTPGVCGLRVCLPGIVKTFSTVWNRSQVFAQGPYGRACWGFNKKGYLRCFQKMTCIFKADAALWRPPSSFCVAGAALRTTCRTACFLRPALSGLRQVVTACKFRGKCGTS